MPDPDQQPQQRSQPDADAEVTDPAPQPAHISRITTSHADEYHSWLTSRYTDHQRTVLARSSGFEFSAESARLGELTSATARYKAATIEADLPAVSYVLASHLRSGEYLVRWQGQEVRLRDRGTILGPPTGFIGVLESSAIRAVGLSLDTVLRVAEELRGLNREQVRFTGLLPISRAAEQQWLTTAEYIHRGIYNLAIAQPLVLAAAEHIVAASMLTTFPNTTMTTEIRTPRDPSTAATVRRAMAFMDEYAGRPITLTDIATAAGVVPRTLQYAFLHHGDTTPLAYLRRVRLALAHDQLLAAQAGDGTTIAAVAARWGYARPGRFAAAYRKAYGEAPSRTLRS
jgi:AraC-like DNA-binding protein